MRAVQMSLFESHAAQRESVDGTYIRELINGPDILPAAGGFVVIERTPRSYHKMYKGRVSDPILWGMGLTGLEACADAYRWVVSSDMTEGVVDPEDLLPSGRFGVYPCSKSVMREVHRYGGEIDFVIDGGRVWLPNELRIKKREALK